MPCYLAGLHGIRAAFHRSRQALTIVAVTVLAALGLAAVPAASADPPGLLMHVGGDPAGWTQSPTRPLLNASNLFPGSSAHSELQLRNDSPASTALSVAATDVHDDQPCVAAAPAVLGRCGPGMGQLGHRLLFTIRRSDTGVVAWSGHIDDLATTTVVPAMPAGSIVGLELSFALPTGADNTVENDALSFGLRWTLTENAGGSQGRVLGEAVLRSGSPAPQRTAPVSGGRLAFTGWPLAPTLLLAGSLLALGTLGVMMAKEGRHRRRS